MFSRMALIRVWNARGDSPGVFPLSILLLNVSASQNLCSDPQVSRLRRSRTPQVDCGDTGEERGSAESRFTRFREHFEARSRAWRATGHRLLHHGGNAFLLRRQGAGHHERGACPSSRMCPKFRESGHDLLVSQCGCRLAPKGISPEMGNMLNAAMETVCADRKFAETLYKPGFLSLQALNTVFRMAYSRFCAGDAVCTYVSFYFDSY